MRAAVHEMMLTAVEWEEEAERHQAPQWRDQPCIQPACRCVCACVYFTRVCLMCSSPSLSPLSCCSCSWASLTRAAAAPATRSGPSVCSGGCRASAECRRAGAGWKRRRWCARGCSQLSGSSGWSCLLRGDTAQSQGWRRRRHRRPASSVGWSAVGACPPPTANRPIREREARLKRRRMVLYKKILWFSTASIGLTSCLRPLHEQALNRAVMLSPVVRMGAVGVLV